MITWETDANLCGNYIASYKAHMDDWLTTDLHFNSEGELFLLERGSGFLCENFSEKNLECLKGVYLDFYHPSFPLQKHISLVDLIEMAKEELQDIFIEERKQARENERHIKSIRTHNI